MPSFSRYYQAPSKESRMVLRPPRGMAYPLSQDVGHARKKHDVRFGRFRDLAQTLHQRPRDQLVRVDDQDPVARRLFQAELPRRVREEVRRSEGHTSELQSRLHLV